MKITLEFHKWPERKPELPKPAGQQERYLIIRSKAIIPALYTSAGVWLLGNEFGYRIEPEMWTEWPNVG